MKTLLVVILLCFLYLVYYFSPSKESFSNQDITIYCINLSRSTDRWHSIVAQSNRNELNVTRIDAVDGFTLSTKALLKNKIISPFDFFSKGTAGCYLSHRKAWQQVVDGTKEWALIIEDDVVFVDNFSYKLQKLLSILPNDWDMVYLGMTRPYGSHLTDNLYKVSYRINSNAGAYAYMVKRNMAKKWLELCGLPMQAMVDHCMKKHHSKFNIYFVYPYLVEHNFNLKPVRLNNKIYSKEYIRNTNKLQTTVSKQRQLSK